MGQFRDALDKQFPPKTDEERAAYYAARRRKLFLADLASRRRWDRRFLLVDRTLDYCIPPALAAVFLATCYLVWLNL